MLLAIDAGIVYDELGPPSGNGRNFVVQPTPLGYLLQSVVLDDTTPFDLDNPLTWGVFSRSLDSLVVMVAVGAPVATQTCWPFWYSSFTSCTYWVVDASALRAARRYWVGSSTPLTLSVKVPLVPTSLGRILASTMR